MRRPKSTAKGTMRWLNRLIDELHRAGIIDERLDWLLHTLNEAVIHRRPGLWLRNTLVYLILPRLRGRGRARS